ncbi:uncharacterized protein BKA55DRAFT_544480 [Fusarium redolens]|uniref:Fungal-type protein kinase domain-containing protein n=1 Tax=Fusarium redolens TaxID=48865 RepID=A0A9P9G892_FUSRE|nr:uncharacterized protein BKA55DRAFT_544480 [Fusarium redolens]KAH7234023.1 hypothetical protein BKA55DRAFT_544480 [Fusarium redolens]
MWDKAVSDDFQVLLALVIVAHPAAIHLKQPMGRERNTAPFIWLLATLILLCAVDVGIFHLCSRNLAPDLWPILLFYQTNEVPTMMTAVHHMSKNRPRLPDGHPNYYHIPADVYENPPVGNGRAPQEIQSQRTAIRCMCCRERNVCESNPTHQHRRRPLAQPNKPIQGSTGERKLDIGFVKNTSAGKDSRCRWSQILVPGKLKSNPSADKASMAWLDLGRHAREVLVAQNTRRFVLSFTICGSLMRVWAFDRLRGIALELSLTLRKMGRIIIDEMMQRAPCVAGRATTCWKAHSEGRSEILLVIKDSWQYPERDEEGELLPKYYHHETAQIDGADDDIWSNVRRGLDITQAANYRPERPIRRSNVVSGTSREGRGSTKAIRKRSSSQAGAPLPSSKRSCSVSSTRASSSLPNRVHRRVILRDYGMPIYKASSRSALLAAFERCIVGHESLYKAGFLHKDILINNLVINENDDNPSWPFLIDLGLAIKESREVVTGVKGKTGTQVFKAIGALLAYIKLLISRITCEWIQLSRKALGHHLERYRSGSG